VSESPARQAFLVTATLRKAALGCHCSDCHSGFGDFDLYFDFDFDFDFFALLALRTGGGGETEEAGRKEEEKKKDAPIPKAW